MVTSPSTVAPQTYVRGFDEAYARLRPAVNDTDTPPEHAFLPLFEALNWAAALSHLERAGQITIAVEPDDIRGIRFARDRAHHHWGNALEVGDTLFPQPLVTVANHGQSRLVAPVVVRTWKWIPLSRPRSQ